MRFHVKPWVWAWLCALWIPFAVLADPEPVHFPGPGIKLAARLYRPPGAGPFPAIVMMHGCSGMWMKNGTTPTPNYRFWAEHFAALGYVAVLVDSFGPRGEREICTQKVRTVSPVKDRPRDAYAALGWLAARNDVDAKRIYLMGWSNGAMAVLNALRLDAPGRTSGHAFRAAVAMYPGCGALAKTQYVPIAPLLIQSGALDDWTRACHCAVLAERSRAVGGRVEIDVYPSAYHAFDSPTGKVRVRPGVHNSASPTGWGATVGPNPEARERAIRRVTAFFASE